MAGAAETPTVPDDVDGMREARAQADAEHARVASASTSPLKSWWARARLCPLQKASGHVRAQLEIVGGQFAIAHLENLSGQSTGAHNEPTPAWYAARSRLETEVGSVAGAGCGLYGCGEGFFLWALETLPFLGGQRFRL